MPIGALGTTPTITDLPQASINPTSHAAQNATTNDLFNGNIRFMQTAITNPDTRDAMPMLNVYQYDQLNRLLESRSYETGLDNNIWNPAGYNNEYYNAFTFDPNGNILTQKRHLRDGTQVEDMTYQYRLATNGDLLRNRLYHINDAIASGVDNKDIDDMGVFEDDPTLIETANNYIRDEEGRLIRNLQEEIEEIVWRVDGKVKEVRRFSTSQLKNVIFDYDAMGNQIAKHIVNNQTGLLEKSTYYILDASGNQMSVYEHEVDAQDVTYTLAERQIYGSSHVGTLKTSVDMYNATQSNLVATELGHKRYSLGDHRGNVNAVISDVKIPVATGTTVDYFDVYIVNVVDFSPFNVELDGRTIKNDFYRYSVQGQEGHDEVLGEGNYINYKYRGYDPRVGRLDWALDPLAGQYPWYTPYQFSGNKLISHRELEGLEEFSVHTYSFAPFNTFGGGFNGDGKNRKFGDKVNYISKNNRSTNFRIGGEVIVNLETGTSELNAFGSYSYNSLFGGTIEKASYSPAHFSKISVLNTVDINQYILGSWSGYLHNYGGNSAAPAPDGVVANIDTYLDLTLGMRWNSDPSDPVIRYVLEAHGALTGDKYPSNEVFVMDSKGQKVMLGVSGADPMGPYIELWTNLLTEENMSKFKININLDKDYNFVSINFMGKNFSIDDWNNIFSNLSPTNTSTNTNINSDDGTFTTVE